MTYVRLYPGLKTGAGTRQTQQDLSPTVDIIERKDSFTIDFDVPGVEKNDVAISVNEGVLSVKGEWKRPVVENDSLFTYLERTTGTFSRSFRLPTFVDADNIKASYKNGILTVEIPKEEEAKPLTIKVK